MSLTLTDLLKGAMLMSETDDQRRLKPPGEWTEDYWKEHVYRGDKVPELTWRAVLIGLLLVIPIVAVNVNMGLKTGFGEGMSLAATIFAFMIGRAFVKKKFSPLENNIAQTVASAGGSVGSIVNVIPAFVLLAGMGVIDAPMSFLQMLFFVLATSLLGPWFAVPMRRPYIVIEKLRFPSGTAAGTMIRNFYDKVSEAANHGGVMTFFAVLASAVKWMQEGIPRILPGATMQTGKWFGVSAGGLRIGAVWDPLLIGAGFLIGPRISFSMLLGSLVSFAFLGPWLVGGEAPIMVPMEYVVGGTKITEHLYQAVIRWAMWPGTAALIASSLMAVAFNWRMIHQSFSDMGSLVKGDGQQMDISMKHWLLGLGGSSAFVVAVMYWGFGTPVWLTLISIFMAFCFSVIAGRCLGETEFNPISAFTSIKQLFVGAIMPTAVMTNLTVAGITGSSASEAPDMLQDWKTGYLVGATPIRQLIAQFPGVIWGSFVAVGMLVMYFSVYTIGADEMPAPGAVRFSAVALLFRDGLGGLPQYSVIAGLIGLVVGTGLALLNFKIPKSVKYTPSAMGFGIGMIIPFFLVVPIALGALILMISRMLSKKIDEHAYDLTIGAGLLFGSSVTGMVIVFLMMIGVLSH